ncbi:MAG: hypothetical protein IT428_07050, partial [Planctomycetaceae bacterium]|nr:hypothetical protein [Planctomycetaceae bacterium]
MSTQTVIGRIHGQSIELDRDLGLIDGQLVEIVLRVVPSPNPEKSGEGLLRTEGALADDPFWDEIMEE